MISLKEYYRLIVDWMKLPDTDLTYISLERRALYRLKQHFLTLREVEENE